MTKTQIFILWGLAIVVVVVLVVVGQVMSRPSVKAAPIVTVPAQSYRLPGVPYSARSLYRHADQAARSWQGDAVLVSVAASWPFADMDGFSQATDWTYQFYSPSTQGIYVVNASEAEVTPIREALSPYPLATVPLDEWRLDSHEALNAWLSAGGGDLLSANPIVDVNVRLRQSEDGQAEWAVVGAVRGSQAIHVARVDARDGTILQ
jgi:hypothetical protein